MKHLIKYIFLFFLVSCVNNNEKIQINNIKSQNTIKYKQHVHFYHKGNIITEYDFNKVPLSKDVDNLSNYKNEDFYVNKNIEKLLEKKENYYKLINYCKLGQNKYYQSYTVFGNYDYYTNILLVTTRGDSLIDHKIIASLLGDADEVVEISTRFLDSISFIITTQYKRLYNNRHKTIRVDSSMYKIDSIGHIVNKH